jgi:signal peptidase I
MTRSTADRRSMVRHRVSTPARRGRLRLPRRVAVVAALLILTGVVGTATTFWLQGYRLYVVHTGSMSPTYKPGDVVIDAPAAGHYRPGEVLTFRHSALTDDVVTHRVVGVQPDGLHTKGDANRSADAWTIRPDQVQGRVVFSVRGLGYLAVYFKQPAGIASLATVAVAVLLLWRLFFAGAEPEDERAATEPAVV